MTTYSSDPPEKDRNFDDLSERFSTTIYDSPRGALRLAALQQDFNDLNLIQPGIRILDAGGGQGQFALWLAQQGAEISLCDVSNEMLSKAKENFAEADLPLDARLCAIQSMQSEFAKQFDGVLNHAVLEWLVDPLAAVGLLCDRVRPGGWLSLMFYNLHGHRWRQMMIGRVHAPDSASRRLRESGNSPANPLDPKDVEQALVKAGMRIARWRGIRCLYDHMHQKIRERVSEQDLFAADLQYGLQEPYRQLGRYVHLLAFKN